MLNDDSWFFVFDKLRTMLLLMALKQAVRVIVVIVRRLDASTDCGRQSCQYNKCENVCVEVCYSIKLKRLYRINIPHTLLKDAWMITIIDF